jgi:hypothetical protein
MLRLTSNKGMAIFHLAKKARNHIAQFEERNAMCVNVPFIDEIANKTRYLTFYKSDNEWRYTGVEDNPTPTHKVQEVKKSKKRKRLTMDELAANAEKLLKEKELKENGKEEFEKGLKKAIKPNNS